MVVLTYGITSFLDPRRLRSPRCPSSSVGVSQESRARPRHSSCCNATVVHRPSMEMPLYSDPQHNLSPCLCHFPRSKHFFCSQGLVLIGDSHHFFIPHLPHQLIGPHFWSKGCMECVDTVSNIASVCCFLDMSNNCPSE